MAELIFKLQGKLSHSLVKFGEVENGVITKAIFPSNLEGDNAGAFTLT